MARAMRLEERSKVSAQTRAQGINFQTPNIFTHRTLAIEPSSSPVCPLHRASPHGLQTMFRAR